MTSKLQMILVSIQNVVKEISYLIRKSNPCTIGQLIGTDNTSGDDVKQLDVQCNRRTVTLRTLSRIAISVSKREPYALRPAQALP